MIRFRQVACTWLLSAAAFAQAPPAGPAPPTTPAPPAKTASAGEMTTHDVPATFSSRVNLVMVPVVVRDAKGKAVGNLSQEDFQLYDRGKLQVISRFAVERTDLPPTPVPPAIDEAAPDKQQPPPPPIPDRFVAYLFDDVHLDTSNLLRVRLAADKHLTESLSPTMRAAIFTTSGMGGLDFTDDMEKLRAEINSIKPHTVLTAAFECPNVTYYMADMIVNHTDGQAAAVVRADTAACNSGITDAAVLDNIAHAAALNALNAGEAEARQSLINVKNMVQRVTAMPGSRSIILVSDGFWVPADDMRTDEAEILDKAIRGNVVINALDARGVYTIIPSGDASTRGISTASSGLRTMYETTAALAQQDILAELADGTGGQFYHNDNGLREGFDQIATRPEFIYVLGFSPQNLRYDGAYHKLKVSLVKGKGLDMQSRRGYTAPRHAADPAEEAKEEIREAVFSREELPDIPVDVRTQFFKSSDTAARLTVVAHVDMKTIHFIDAEGRHKDNLTVVAGIFDKNGNFVNGLQRLIEMNLKDSTLETVASQGITVRTAFDVMPGTYTIRVVVRDSEGQTMAARNGAVQIP
ncbi:MAG TPA: VWA domain-containing protein [Bryobacteraceae bacterium]